MNSNIFKIYKPKQKTVLPLKRVYFIILQNHTTKIRYFKLVIKLELFYINNLKPQNFLLFFTSNIFLPNINIMVTEENFLTKFYKSLTLNKILIK